MDEQEAQCAEAPEPSKSIGPHFDEMYWRWKDRQNADPVEVLANTIDHNEEQQRHRGADQSMHFYGVLQKLEGRLNDLDDMNKEVMKSLGSLVGRIVNIENNPGLVRKPSVAQPFEAQPFA